MAAIGCLLKERNCLRIIACVVEFLAGMVVRIRRIVELDSALFDGEPADTVAEISDQNDLDECASRLTTALSVEPIEESPKDHDGNRPDIKFAKRVKAFGQVKQKL